MRKLLIAMAGCIGVVSILLTARYGWKQADEEIDRWIAAVMFGSISLCAFVFDALAVRLWFVGWRKAGGFIGFIAALAFVVTFSNSLGGIVSRADTVQAQRQSVTDARADNRRELQRLEQALKDLGKFTPADTEAVAAAKTALATAKQTREAECDKRGPNCRQRELDEQAAATALRDVTAHKATTDAAKRYEAQIGAVKAKLASPEGAAIAHANPLGNALALIIGTAADVLTARMQAIIALVFDLCLGRFDDRGRGPWPCARIVGQLERHRPKLKRHLAGGTANHHYRSRANARKIAAQYPAQSSWQLALSHWPARSPRS